MKITSIRHERVYNLGNYESQRFDATAELDAGEDPVEAMYALRRFVEAQGTRRQAPLAIVDDRPAANPDETPF